MSKTTSTPAKETTVSLIDRVMARINKPENEKIKEKVLMNIEDTLLKVKGTIVKYQHEIDTVKTTEIERAEKDVTRATADLEDAYIAFDEKTTPESYLLNINRKREAVAEAKHKLAVLKEERDSTKAALAEMVEIQTILS